MEKYTIDHRTIKTDDGEEKEFYVLQKWRRNNITDDKGRIHYNVIEPQEIWFSPYETKDILYVLNNI